MTKIIKIITVPAMALLFGFAALAHTGEGSGTQATEMMRMMMGSEAFGSMEQMEETMMGAESHERMEELMEKMMAGNLTSEELDEMRRFMSDDEMGPGAMTMMMRMMMPQAVKQGGMFLPGGRMMEGDLDKVGPFHRAGAMYGYGVLSGFVHWITIILLWAFLFSGTAAFLRWLRKNK